MGRQAFIMLRSVVAFTALASGSAFAPALTQTTLSRPRHGSSMRMQESLLEGKARRVEDIRAMQPLPSSLEQKVRLTPELFRQLDVYNSGTIEVGEFKDIFKSPYFESIELDEFAAELTADTLFKRADLDGNGRLDYAEYERLMNMQKNGDEWGGNKYVRAAIKAGLLKPDSPLADGEASVLVGNKGFDPVGFATSLKTLKAYREAELKHGRLAMLAALGWPVSELAPLPRETDRSGGSAGEGARSSREGAVGAKRWPRQHQPPFFSWQPLSFLARLSLRPSSRFAAQTTSPVTLALTRLKSIRALVALRSAASWS